MQLVALSAKLSPANLVLRISEGNSLNTPPISFRNLSLRRLVCALIEFEPTEILLESHREFLSFAPRTQLSPRSGLVLKLSNSVSLRAGSSRRKKEGELEF